MKSKKKKELVDDLMGISSNDEEKDFLDRPFKKSKKVQVREIDLGAYIPDHFEKEDIPKREAAHTNKESENSFITSVTESLPVINKKTVNTKKEDALKNYDETFSNNRNDHTKTAKITIMDDPNKEILKNDHNSKKKKSKFSIVISFVFTIMFIASLAYVGYALLFGDAQIKQTEFLINSILLIVLSFCMIVSHGAERIEKRDGFVLLEGLTMIAFLLFNLLSATELIHLPQNSVMKDFTGVSITEAMKWADKNHIQVEQVYDNSDSVEEYSITRQSVYPNVLASKIKTVEFTVSSGPDYDKEATITNMVGWNIDEAVKVIDENFLNNVNVEFVIDSETTKDVIMEQSKSGQMKRKDELNLTVSLGSQTSSTPVTMIDLTNMSKFKAILWLKRNEIKFNEKSEFSNKVKRNYIMKQSTEKGKKINTKTDTLDITFSKGKKIITPDLSKMSMKQITKWIVENRLKIEFTERYDTKIKQGKVIEVNYKEKDEIEEGTLIKVVTSKGQLKMPKFTDVQAFRDWANKYSVPFTEEYMVNKDIEKGKIIRFSTEAGNVLNPSESITVYISSGGTITIPNFIGKTKSNIENICKNTGIQCTFFYAGNSSKDKDIALSQNKAIGSEVVKDTYVNIGLSSGKYTSNPNVNGSTSRPNNDSSSGGTVTPTPPQDPVPSCENIVVYLGAGGSVSDTKFLIQNQNPKFKFNFVTGDPGYGVSGSLYDNMFALYHGKKLNTCNTITINIVSK